MGKMEEIKSNWYINMPVNEVYIYFYHLKESNGICVGYEVPCETGWRWIETEIEPHLNWSEAIKPILKIPFRDKGFFDAVQSFCDDKNMRTPRQEKIQGTLDATQDHLKDMRKITFNLLKN